MASRDECNNNARLDGSSPLPTLLLPPDPASAFLFHPPLPDTGPLVRPIVLGTCQAVEERKKLNGRERKNCGFPPQSVLRLRALSFYPSVHLAIFFPLYTPPPHPQRLAPVVILRLAVGFMQALAGTPRMPGWRGALVGPSVWGSVEMCGGR